MHFTQWDLHQPAEAFMPYLWAIPPTPVLGFLEASIEGILDFGTPANG